ncbi:21461_t:CDS:2, partial [Racocetra persica]
NALEDNIGISNPIIEAVFDYMIIVLIPVILTFDINAKEAKKLTKLFEFLQILLLLVVFALPSLATSLSSFTVDLIFLILSAHRQYNDPNSDQPKPNYKTQT